MWNAIHEGNRPCGGATLAEGIAVKNVGKLTLPIVRDTVSDIILVDEALIERAVNAFLTLQKTMAEGAGAAGLAAMLAEPEQISRPQGRADSLRRQHRSAHPGLHHGARTGTRRSHRRRSALPFPIVREFSVRSRPRLGELGANILSVDHHRLFLDVPAKGAKLDVTVETRDAAHADEIFRALAADGYQPVHMPSGTARE